MVGENRLSNLRLMEEINRRYKTYTPDQAYVKIRHYCAFQERTHQEVKMKLRGYGLAWSDIEQMISKLIEEGFLNEERFAAAFVGGKFRMKQWGRKKIEMELRKKQVSEYNVKKAIRDEIDMDEYQKTISKLIEKKWNSIKPADDTMYTKQAKVRAYMLQRGFENNFISEGMKAFLKNDE